MVPDLDLISFCLGELAEPRRGEVAGAIARDVQTRDRHTLIRRMLDTLPAAMREDPFRVSLAARTRLIGLMARPEEVRPSLLETVRAWLTRDSAGEGLLAPGFRGGGEARSLAYEWPDGAVEMRVEEEQPGRFVLTGRCAGAEPPVEAAAESATDRACDVVSEDGFFELRLGPGAWDITLWSPAGETRLPTLVLGD